MKKRLDERQENELLKIEHNGFWILFWGITAVIIVRSLTGSDTVACNVMEAVFFVTAAFMLFEQCRKGIWDRHLRPTRGTNLLISLVASVVATALVAVRIAENMTAAGKTPTEYPICFILLAVSFVFIFALCLITLTVLAKLTEKRLKSLEKEPDQEK